MTYMVIGPHIQVARNYMHDMLLNIKPQKFFFNDSYYRINNDYYYLITSIEQLYGHLKYKIILLPYYQDAGFLRDPGNMDHFRFFCSTAEKVIYAKQS